MNAQGARMRKALCAVCRKPAGVMTSDLQVHITAQMRIGSESLW
jgi:hypothetical protein